MKKIFSILSMFLMTFTVFGMTSVKAENTYKSYKVGEVIEAQVDKQGNKGKFIVIGDSPTTSDEVVVIQKNDGLNTAIKNRNIKYDSNNDFTIDSRDTGTIQDIKVTNAEIRSAITFNNAGAGIGTVNRFITQAPETAIDNQTITKNSTNELQTIGVKYNDNLITAEMIYNATHYIRYKEDEPTPPTPPTPTGEAGLYVNGVLTKTWAQLISDGDIITNVEDMDVLFVANTSLQGDLVCDNVEGSTYSGLSFENCSTLTSIDTSKLDTSNVIAMSFYYCSSLTSLNLSNFNMSNATSMYQMFSSCSSLTSLDLSNFNTSNVTDMSFMFNDCRALTGLNLSKFNTSNVTDMRQMFYNCSSLTSLDLSNFNTTKVTDMSNMFYSCSSLTSLDISNFTFDKVTDYTDMFTGVPADCEILVKSQAEKDWITSKFTNLTNVKIKGAV